MAYGKRDGLGYLDGIPVKISETIRAPRKVTLPVNFHQNIPSDLLTEDYDFFLEEQVLTNAEFRRQAIRELAKAKVEKVASDIEDFTKVNNPNESECEIAMQQHDECPEEGHDTIERSARLPPWQPTKILTPQPLASKDSNKSVPPVQTKEFNLADFENETSPFDYMELQTINDLEELNTVFQGMAMSDSSPVDGRRVARAQFPVPQQQQLSTNGFYSDDSQPDDTTALNVDARNAKVTFSSLSNFYKSYPPPVSNGYSVQQQVLYDLTRVPSDSDKKGAREVSRLRSAKSVSDIYIASEGSSGIKPTRSHTPPPTPVHRVTVTNKVGGDVERRSHSFSGNASQELAVPDPFVELSREEQNFVSSLTDMGFPRARVSRGVKQLGMDDKKVVDYLCLVQSLEDAGYDGWDTEMALHLHNYSVEEAKSFLDLLVQFQDLGFDKDLARKALVRHKNDRDKALDALLT